ncbi:MAG: hypothetical protein LBH44_00705 [Treponema sp.]|jgi:hypothetical protein|nr:hypothetical protein [Treponema sp.]
MSDIESRSNIPSTSTLAKQGLTAAVCAAGGIFLIILQIVSKFRVLGLIVSVVVCAVGIGALMSKDPTDRKPGAVITAAGVLAVLSKIKFIAPLAGTLLSIGAVGLLAMGIYNGIKFFKGLKDRS